MIHQYRVATAFAALLAIAPCARAQASFQGLGDLPGGATGSTALGVSGDGSVVIGDGQGPLGQEAVRWADGTPAGLGDLPGGIFGSRAYGVAQSDSVVVGYSWVANGAEAFRWSEATGIVGLGDLPGGNFESIAHDVSADGSVVVGESVGADDGTQAFRWTAAGGMVGLGDLPGGGKPSSYAHGVSADGEVVVGRGRTDSGTEAFMWTPAGGMVSLGTLPDPGAGGSASSANAVSDDGTVIVGRSGTQAFRWTAASGMVGLGFPPGATGSDALAVSADGAVVVGGSGGGTNPGAFIWTAQEGMRSLRDSLIAAGVDMDGWILQQATGVSSDGSVIVGIGTNPQGLLEAWRAVLGGQCEAGAATAVRFWDDPAGGPFADPTRWLEGEVPGTSDVAAFQFPDGTNYTVGFSADQTNDALSVEGGNDVNFALGGRTYTLSGASGCRESIRVGGTGGASSVLAVAEGTLSALAGLTVAGGEASAVEAEVGGSLLAIGTLLVGSDIGTHGEIRAEAGGHVTLAATSPIIVGGAGTGSISVAGGSQGTVGGPVHIASQEGGRGIVRVHGTGSQLTMNGIIEVGLRGNGNLFAGDLASLDAGTVVLGRDGVGELTLFPFGIAQVTDLWAGVNGGGGVWVMAGGRLTAGGAFVPGGSGNGNVVVEGLGAELRADSLRLGGPGTGRLNVIDGGCVRVRAYSQLIGGSLNTPTGTFQMGNADAPCPPPQEGADNFIAADSAWIGTGTVLDSVTVTLLTGGVLGGGGTVAADLTNAGAINAGDSAGVAGTFTIGGAYTQAPAGVLEAELAGATSHDVLAVAGAATLDGTLRFRYLGGFNPSPGDAFTVLTAGSVAGEFAAIEGPAGSTYSVAYGPTSVTATVLAVDDEPGPGEAGLVLHPPAPNPAVGRMVIRYELPAAGSARLAVYDALGREVAVLVEAEVMAGAHEASLDSRFMAAGQYVILLATNTGSARRLATILD